MKRIFMMIMLAAISSLTAVAQTKQGDSSVGLNVGYAFDSENATIGVDYRYNVTNEFRLAPGLTYLAKDHGLSAFMFDMNAHYVFEMSDKFGFYPLGGLSLSFWDGGHSYTRFGLNLGLGGEVYATKEITVGLEAKYNIIADFDQAYMAVRVAYNF